MSEPSVTEEVIWEARLDGPHRVIRRTTAKPINTCIEHIVYVDGEHTRPKPLGEPLATWSQAMDHVVAMLRERIVEARVKIAEAAVDIALAEARIAELLAMEPPD